MFWELSCPRLRLRLDGEWRPYFTPTTNFSRDKVCNLEHGVGEGGLPAVYTKNCKGMLLANDAVGGLLTVRRHDAMPELIGG